MDITKGLVTVPARLTAFVDVEIELKNGSVVVIEPKLHCQKGKEWSTPRAVIRVVDRRASIPITNLSSNKLRLQNGRVKWRALKLTTGELENDSARKEEAVFNDACFQ